ncbi:MAG: hypothetical protein FWC51_00905 [Proteobacteria bacterium]|nr:hypothetical protein [Pseudomonadota bacterium]
MKARTRRKLFYFALGVVLLAAAAVVVVPPFLNFDRLKPQITAAVLNQTGLHMTIDGRLRLSLLGRATLSADRVSVAEYGAIDSVSFYIPFRGLLNTGAIGTSSTIILDGAHLNLNTLIPPTGIGARLVIRDSSVMFMGKLYDQINGVFNNGAFDGTIRTNQHKYTLNFHDNTFHITNPNIKLDIAGSLSVDDAGGISAAGQMSMDTADINRWFEFEIPKITERTKFKSDFIWSGDRFRFYNISGEMGDADFNGEIEFGPGYKKISIVANNLTYDFSFLLEHPEFMQNSEINFAGNGHFVMRGLMGGGAHLGLVGKNVRGTPADEEFSKIKIRVASDADTTTIRSLVLQSDNFVLTARGEISGTTANNLDLTFYRNDPNVSVHCLLSGVANDWTCARFDYADAVFSATGTLTVRPDTFHLKFLSDNFGAADADISTLNAHLSTLFNRAKGTVEFALGDGTNGTIKIDGKNTDIEYAAHPETTLAALPVHHEFFTVLPAEMMNAVGTMKYAHFVNGRLAAFSFAYDGKKTQWTLGIDGDGLLQFSADARYLISAYYPNLDAKFLAPSLPMALSGHYKSGLIPDLRITIVSSDVAAFTGKFDGTSFDLHTDMLDLDTLIDGNFIDDYASAQYVTAEPLAFPFALGLNATLTADHIKFNNEVYDNFIYSLRPTTQKMSVTDTARGSVLLSIDKKLAAYHLLVQLGKFETVGTVLPLSSSLNVADSTITAQMAMDTFGITAHDFWANLSGDLDITFDGGTLIGFDIDKFYANAADITKMNAEFAISDALDGGSTKLKSLHLVGHYENGEFRTTRPLTAGARHSEITGDFWAARGKVAARLNVLLRATAPDPKPIAITISPNGNRDYSLSDIMLIFDPDFMRVFIKMHDKF